LKKLVIFDLDGTLAKSKSALDAEMAGLLEDLMQVAQVAVISGGDWPQFEKQLVQGLGPAVSLENLSLLPTCGTKYFHFKDGWQRVYSEEIATQDKVRIIDAFHAALDQSGFKPERTWGELIEDRGSQITFSALGQEAPLDAKAVWDPDFGKRKLIMDVLSPLIPEFTIRVGGATSIDVTRPGIDKAYGIKKLSEMLDIKIAEMLFIGDALFPGGNDYPAKELGVAAIQVRDPEETKRVIEAVLSFAQTAVGPGHLAGRSDSCARVGRWH
jgi:HAD superfamily hydrolase (TIGR01484 family)